jgi:hypothetical protein
MTVLYPSTVLVAGRQVNLTLRVTIAILLIVALCPVLFVPIPAMVDYPNHLARMYLLSRDGTPDANPFYQTAWALYPNLAMDIAIPQMARVMDVENATRLFLFISQLLIVGGTFVIERVVKGRNQLAGAAAVVFLYALPFTWGFINFEFALGIALMGIAVAVSVQERSSLCRLPVHTVFVVVLFISHFFALGVYGATLGLLELHRAWQKKAVLRETVLRLLALAAPAVVMLAIMMLTAGAIGGGKTIWHFAFKTAWIFMILNGYRISVAAGTMVVLIAFIYIAVRQGVLKFGTAGICLAAGFGLLYLAIPSQLFGTGFVDLRMIVAAAFILPAFCSLSVPDRRWTLATLACLVAVAVPNLAVVYSVWFSYRAEYAAMIGSFAKLEKNSLVMIGGSRSADDPPFEDLTLFPIEHAPVLAVHYASAFVPDLFNAPGKQPIRVRPEVERLDVPETGPVPLVILKGLADGKMSDLVPLYFRTWYRDFDYLYVLGTHVENPMPDLLEELDRSSRFILYKIHRRRL